MEEKEMRHVPPGLLVLRLCSTPTLVPHFSVDLATSYASMTSVIYPLARDSVMNCYVASSSSAVWQ